MRSIIVGDVHGCREELEGLLDDVHFASGDHLVLVGDILARGPDSLGVLDIVRATGASFVLGNHEMKLLSHRKAPETPLGRGHQPIFDALRDSDWKLLESAPYMLDLKEHEARVVHAGVLPGVPWEEQKPSTFVHLRAVTARGEFGERGVHPLWGSLYEGPPHVLFGHNAIDGLQMHPWATGLDTGCVYGGRLTAIVLDQGEPVPKATRARMNRIVSRAARRVHYDPKTHTRL